MKKITAMLTLVLTAMCFTVTTYAADANQKPFLEDFMNSYGDYVLIGALGIFFIIAVILLICVPVSRKKKKKNAKKEVSKQEARTGTKYTVLTTLDDQDSAVVQPLNYYHYDYRTYRNGELMTQAPRKGCVDLEYAARRVPEYHVREIPTPRYSPKAVKPLPPRPLKPAEPTLPVRTIEVKTVSAEKAEQDGVVEIKDQAAPINKKHIVAAVVLTAVGIHMLRRKFKKK